MYVIVILLILGFVMLLGAEPLWRVHRGFSDRPEDSYPSYKVVPWIRRIGVLIIVVTAVWYVLGFTSCVPPAASGRSYPEIVYPDEYVEGQDFNYTAFSTRPNTLAVTDKGIYFKTEKFVYYANFDSLKAHPLCYRLTCLHRTGGWEEYADCNAFSGPEVGQDFLGVFRDHVYYTIYYDSKFSYKGESSIPALVRTRLDGSDRETVIPDVNQIIGNQIRIHRGVLYYPEVVADPDGTYRYALMAMDLTSDRFESEHLLDGAVTAGTFTEILPYGNYIYYNEILAGEQEDGSKLRKIRYLRYHILNRTVEAVTDYSDLQLKSIIDGRLILFDGSDYYELDPETKEIRISELGIQKYAEAHPEWSCDAHCIRNDIAFLTSMDDCTDNGTDYGTWNRRIINDNGAETECAEQQNYIWEKASDQIITIKGEEYYVWYNANVTDYSVGLYKVKDLLAGKLKPRYMFGPTDENGLGGNGFHWP